VPAPGACVRVLRDRVVVQMTWQSPYVPWLPGCCAQALALGEDPPHEDELVDHTRPDVADIDRLGGEQLQAFKALAVESQASEAPAGKYRVCEQGQPTGSTVCVPATAVVLFF
jgi:hypothetical protein